MTQLTTPAARKTEDFASAAMMRLVHAGLIRQGIAPPLDRPRGAHVPRAAKRAVLQDLLSVHGPLAILRIADAIPQMPPEPVLQALVLARDLEDLMDRWARVEAFSHNRHRIEATHVADGQVRLKHLSRVEGQRPCRAETLLVIGVLTRIAETALDTNATLDLGAGSLWRQNGRWADNALPDRIESAGLTCNAETRPAVVSGTPCAELPIGDLRASLKSDPVRRWKIGDLARETGVSVRSLQRKLAEQSLSFSTLVADTRLETAAQRLCARDGPGLSEVGFLSGYSDQAHFTRAFKRSVGTTPGEYRSEFRVDT